MGAGGVVLAGEKAPSHVNYQSRNFTTGLHISQFCRGFVFSWGSLFQNDSIMCQAGIKLASRTYNWSS